MIIKTGLQLYFSHRRMTVCTENQCFLFSSMKEATSKASGNNADTRKNQQQQ